jgi:hypothetical protein
MAWQVCPDGIVAVPVPAVPDVWGFFDINNDDDLEILARSVRAATVRYPRLLQQWRPPRLLSKERLYRPLAADSAFRACFLLTSTSTNSACMSSMLFSGRADVQFNWPSGNLDSSPPSLAAARLKSAPRASTPLRLQSGSIPVSCSIATHTPEATWEMTGSG